MSNNCVITLMSFFVGILIGLTSMGGAALMTPFLILVVGMRPVMAVGTDLVYSAITKIAGATMHWRQRTVDFYTVLLLACGSVPGGLLGVMTIVQLRRRGIDADQWVRHAIGIALVTVAVILLLRSLYLSGPEAIPDSLVRHKNFWTISWGALVGFAVGLTSVGSGSLMVPFLMLLFPLSPALMVGTDVFHSALLVSATALLHVRLGHFDSALLGPLLLGSIPGVLLGSYFAPRMSPRTLRVGLSIVLFATGVKLV